MIFINSDKSVYHENAIDGSNDNSIAIISHQRLDAAYAGSYINHAMVEGDE